MPRDITVTFSDGGTHVYRGTPDDVTPDQVTARAKKDFGRDVAALDGGRSESAFAPPEKPQASKSVGATLRDIPRQVGLTARYGLEGLGRVADIGTEPIRHIVVNPTARLAGLPEVRRSTSEGATALADLIGLPSPQTADERVVGDATRTLASAAGMGGLAGRAAQGAKGVSRNVFQALAANPGAQAAGAVGAGLAGGAVREAGGGQGEQALAALLAGVGGGVAAQTAGRGLKAGSDVANRLMNPASMQQVDNQINLVFERAGIDWRGMPENIRAGLRAEVAQALETGQPMNDNALRRLAVLRRAEVTPTVGMLTQDPGQITREMNLAKTGANSTDTALQRLPAIQNANTQSLLNQLDEAGAAGAPTASGAGRSAIDALAGREAQSRGEINALYSAARDTQGRAARLDPHAFTVRTGQLLDEASLGSFLPPDIRTKVNAIATGRPGYEFNVDSAEQLKTAIGNLQRSSSDGNVRRALGLVRQALDDAPLLPATGRNPGNLPAVQGSPSPITLGEESIQAFNAARAANRQWMTRVEGNPALKAVVEGVEPDRFVQKFVIGQGASAEDVRMLRKELDPAALGSIRAYLVRHLKDAATNSTDDITKFSNASYRKALRDIGDEKLATFFNEKEIQKLRDIGDAAKYMQAQPSGSAVNNSNSGALLLGRGLEWLDKVANYIPLGGRDIIKGKIQGMQQTQVLNPQNALVQLTRRPSQSAPVNPLLALTATTPVEARQDERRH